MEVDRVGHGIEGHAREHARQPEAMVTVHVREADAGDHVCGHPGVDHLALRSLARIKKQALAVPAQEVAVMVPGPGGDLGSGAEDNELAHGF
nr:hypothetical protein GCM10017547_37900 [Pseudarthrobacter oxydans]